MLLSMCSSSSLLSLSRRQFKCCGSNSSSDWAESLWVHSAEAQGRLVPDSCCKTETEGCGHRDHPSNIYKVEVREGQAVGLGD